MALNPMLHIAPPVHLSDMDGMFSQSGVYFLWQGDAVVYVGQARNMTTRILQHAVEGAKVFDGVSCQPCVVKDLNRRERFYIEALLPRYNRCNFSQSIRRIWVGHMGHRPTPDLSVNAEVAAQILGVTRDQLRLLHQHGLAYHRRRIPRCNYRRTFYSVRDLHQFTAQKADAIIALRA